MNRSKAEPLKLLLFFPILFFGGLATAQNHNGYFGKLRADLKNGHLDSIEVHLNELYTNHSDSNLIPLTLYNFGRELYDHQELDLLYAYSWRMLDYTAEKQGTQFTETEDPIWNHHIRSLMCCRIHQKAHYFLASIYLDRQQYDSCLIHLDQTSLLNLNPKIRRFRYNVTASLHTSMMRSICWEHLGEKQKAREILIPYLFLDSFHEEDHYFTHKDAVAQYIHLLETSDSLPDFVFSSKDTLHVQLVKPKKSSKKRWGHSEPEAYTNLNDSILNPKGWGYFQSSPVGWYVRVEDAYVPVYIHYSNYPLGESQKNFQFQPYFEQTLFYRQFYENE